MKKIYFALMIAALCAAPAISQAQNKSVFVDSSDHIRIGAYDFSRQELNKVVTRKLTIFSNYLRILANKTDPDLNGAIDKTMKLFNDRDSTLISITNITTKTRTTKTMRKYLTAMSVLPYDHVDITDHGIVFVSNLQRNPDGSYQGEARYVQDFTATRDNKVVYSDKEEKVVKITIRLYDEIRNGKMQSMFALFLGDMTVSEKRA